MASAEFKLPAEIDVEHYESESFVDKYYGN
jgi:hypothetical protein